MWTPKRILIQVAGVLACVACFTVYSVILGVIDGVPPLPITKLPSGIDEENIGPLQYETDEKLERAFGAGCKELQRALKLWLPDKGIAIAAGGFVIDKDGKVRLAPFSAAFYHKSKTPGEHPEISTIRADIAILTLDQQVTQFSELNNRKIIAVEMVGRQPGITLTNNRRTKEKHDDIDILVTNGNLVYEERYDLISTDGIVCLTDHQSKPPTVIRGKGLDMHLAKDTGPNRPKQARPRPTNQTHDNGNIERIKLRTDVEMFFWVDAKSGFLGGTPNTKKSVVANSSPASTAPPQKARIHIRTGGPFVYDLTKELAWFESPPHRSASTPKAEADAFAPDQVHVQRSQKLHGKETFDQLSCDRLDLQFRRKPGGDGTPDGDKEIETARATRRDANEVVLALDSEGMAAFGNEMFYRAGDAVNGPLTILKGEPLRTAKDGHKMVSKEMHLFGANRFGEGQKAWAKGPGQIDLLDAKSTDKQVFPTHVIWHDTLTVVKEKEGGEVFDLMTVEGEASFIDDQQKQELHGEKIMVWIRQLHESAKKPDAIGGGRQELHRVIAIDRVRASAPEFIVRRTNRLTMISVPELARDARLPDQLPMIEIKNGPTTIDAKGPPPPLEPKVEPPMPLETKAQPEPKKPAPPIELEGNEITVAIATLLGKKELQELIAKGNVHVFQAGEKAGEKRIDITGSLLTVKHAEKGHTMIVYGDKERTARVDLQDTVIRGPIVTINQADNRAAVEGKGSMEMPSNKTIDGTQTAGNKNTRIAINWNSRMAFDGQQARFEGGVQAHEIGTHSRALCQVLTAILDRHVSFKDGQKDKQNAKIDRLIFDKNVYIDDCRVDDKNQVTQHNRLQGVILINQEDGPTRVSGPGWVKLLAKGAADPSLAPAPGANQKAPDKLEWKLTHIKFREGMTSTSRPNGKKTTFYGSNSGVEVFHFPTLKIDDVMDADKPKKDHVYLRCDVLEVEGVQNGDRTTQIMIARTNVYFRTDQYLGYADVVKYDEANDRVIFEGLNGNPVRLYKMVGDRPVPESVKSVKVLYNRKTGLIETTGVTSITN